MIRTDEKRDGAIDFADPDLGGAGPEIKGHVFGLSQRGIRGRKNLDGNVRGALEKGQPADPGFRSTGDNLC